MQQSARHGAKLNYIKSLKHQCAEDEEVYYYKRGGSVGCGCKKKEDGGPLTNRYNKLKKKVNDSVERFKTRKKGYIKADKNATFDTTSAKYIPSKEDYYVQPPASQSEPSKKKKPQSKINNIKCGTKIKK